LLEELTEKEKIAIANRYKPLLVLYPEIESNSERKDHYHSGHRAGRPPIDQDYHPRDIEIVLDNVSLPGIKMKFRRVFRKRVFRKMSRSDILDAMSNNVVDHIDLVPNAPPSNVDKFWKVYASIQNKDLRYPRKAYARIVSGSRRYAEHLVVQYWLAYFFDDWANVHEMDWEMISVVIKKTTQEERPIACAYRAHMGAFRAPWEDIEKANEDGERTEAGTHPIVYVANGSHACYFCDDPVHSASAALVGHELSKWLNRVLGTRRTFSDYVVSLNEGFKHFPEIALMPEPNLEGRWESEWRWLNFKGKWGSKGEMRWITWWKALLVVLRLLGVLRSEPTALPIVEGGPVGPSRQGLCWGDPFAWIEEECFKVEKSWILSR